MKKILSILIIAVLFAACGASNPGESPKDLPGLKSQLQQKEEQLLALKDEISTIKSQIKELDPEFDKKEIQVVEMMELQRSEFNHYVEVQGLIEAGETKFISSEIPGQILKLYVKEGSRIKKGQLLAQIDAENMKKSIEELETGLTLAKDLYERQKRLWEKKIGSELQYLQAKNNMERLEKSLEAAEVSLKKANIYSPLTGTVERLMNKEGEIASPGVPILHLISIDKVKVVADVPEVYVRNIKRRDMVRVSVPVVELEQEVPVYRIGQIINQNNRTFDVEVRLNNPGYELKPNMLALLYVNDYKAEDVLSVPLELVQQDLSGQSFVYVVDVKEGKNYVSKKIVETGLTYDGNVEITKGLEGNEKLITTGTQYLAEGEEIKLKQTNS